MTRRVDNLKFSFFSQRVEFSGRHVFSSDAQQA